MSWRRATFKGGQVWAEVDAAGALVVRSGRVSIRYKRDAGAKVYAASAAGVSAIAEAPIEALPDGEAAASGQGAKASKGSGFGSAKSRSVAQQQAASAHAEAQRAELPAHTIVAYTDGGCRGNPGPAGSGVRLDLPDGRWVDACRALGHGTNNIAELTAIGMALELLDEERVPADAPVVIFSDSSYARGVLTQGWKAKANTELIAGLRAGLRARPGVELRWVAGHAGVAGNERADALATLGVGGTTLTRRS